MKLPGKATLIANAVLLGLTLLLYAADIYAWSRARSAEVSAMPELPRVGYAALVLVAALLGAALVLFGIFTDKPASFRGYRIVPIVAVVAVFVDLFVLSADQIPVPSVDQTLIAVNAFARAASERSSADHVFVNDAQLSDMAKELGQPPYLVRGVRAQGFSVQRRDKCDGPVKDAPGAQVGTLLYCVSRDQKRAWVTVVGLPGEQSFGVPAVITRHGDPQGAVVEALATEELTGDEPGATPLPDGGFALPVDSPEGDDGSP